MQARSKSRAHLSRLAQRTSLLPMDRSRRALQWCSRGKVPYDDRPPSIYIAVCSKIRGMCQDAWRYARISWRSCFICPSVAEWRTVSPLLVTTMFPQLISRSFGSIACSASGFRHCPRVVNLPPLTPIHCLFADHYHQRRRLPHIPSRCYLLPLL